MNPLSRRRRGNAEGWDEANSPCPVETHGLAEPRERRSRPQDPNQDGLIRITRPASHSSAAMKDEGIVQPVSKEMEQLSRRLHQKCMFPGEIRGACLSSAIYDAS